MLQFPKQFYLASKSPRRADLLRHIGVNFEIITIDFNEQFFFQKDPVNFVQELSLLKAKEAIKNIENGIVLTADTIVYIDGTILGKPEDSNDAKKMLSILSGNWHEVYTGFTLYDKPSNVSLTNYSKTTVKFKKLTEEEINSYISTGSPYDKAGAYGIQDGLCALFIEEISGCFYNVIGFPLNKFYISALDFIKKIKQ